MIFVMIIILFGLFCFFGQKKVQLFNSVVDISDKNSFDQVRAIFESDVFVRRQSKIAYASNQKGDICMGFWEKTLGELKYLVYNFRVDEKGKNLKDIFRHCLNENCSENIANNIDKGIYSLPSKSMANRLTLNDYATGTVIVEGNLIKIQLGDYSYAFERKGWER